MPKCEICGHTCHCIVDGSCTIDRCDCGNCICKKED
jgi:hypothetical protein